MNTIFVCFYCGTEKHSENGTGSDVRCCGEVGHVDEMEPEEFTEVTDEKA